MIQRELKIQRAADLRLPLKNVMIQGGALEQPEVRDDVDAVARQFFPSGSPAPHPARRVPGRAGRPRDRSPDRRRPNPHHVGPSDLTGVYLAYLDYLAAFEKFDELSAFTAATSLTAEQRRECELKIVELLARAAARPESSARCRAYLKTYAGGAGAAKADLSAVASAKADDAVLHGSAARMQAVDENQLVVNAAATFADLPIKDPCVMCGPSWSGASRRTAPPGRRPGMPSSTRLPALRESA